MKVLLLSPYGDALARTIEKVGDEVVSAGPCDIAVMFGHRDILKEPFLTQMRMKGGVINIHIGFLPYNRGASPNFWSWYDGTPSGVTIHHVDNGIDTGPIITQQLCWAHDLHHETLRTTYDKLMLTAEAMFAGWWPSIRQGIEGKPQSGKGTYHKKKDFFRLRDKLPKLWDTPICEVVELGRKSRETVEQDSGHQMGRIGTQG